MIKQLLNPDSDQWDYTTLNGNDEYSRYFNQLAKAFRLLLAAYQLAPEKEHDEAEIVSNHLSRFLYTVAALRMKYLYRPQGERTLWIDLSESGFPNFSEIANLGIDQKNAMTQLQAIPAGTIIKRAILNHIITHLDPHPEGLLCQMGQRTYVEMLLSGEKLFLPMNMGELQRKNGADTDSTRAYELSWSCYDFKTNRPYVHIMRFEQDSDEQPLEEHGKNWEEFRNVLLAEGSRVPNVGILAIAIDSTIDPIHPKQIKRISLGPFYTPLLLQSHMEPGSDERELAVRDLMLRSSRHDDDFIFFFTYDVIVSERQKRVKRLFTTVTREIFYIPRDNLECEDRVASEIHRYILLPHTLLQHVDVTHEAAVPKVRNCKRIVYNEKGDIYGV